MLKKTYRLTRNQVTRVYQKGKTFHFEDFIIKYSSRASKPLRALNAKFPPSNSREYARFAISCPLKVSKKAVERNLIRRRLYEIIRLAASLPIPGDYLIIVKQSILSKDFSQMKSMLLSALKRINETPTRPSH